MKTLTTTIDLVRTDRQPVHFASIMVKMVGTIMASSFVAGSTGDLWLASVVVVGYPSSWAVAWLISKK